MTAVIPNGDRDPYERQRKYAMIKDMNALLHRALWEPGFLQVFRIYAWLRVMSLALLLLVGRYVPLQAEAESASSAVLPLTYSVVHTIVLLAILYWPWLQRSLGRYFVPSSLILATAALIVEQYIFWAQRMTWQVHPFLNILLILVAWQYSYRYVVVYTLISAVFETGLNLITPLPQRVLMILPGSPNQMAFGLMFSRSITFLLLGYVVSRLAKAQREQRQELAEANQKLVNHAATLEQLATSRERLRLSRELHDTLAHSLSALTVQFEALETLQDTFPPKAQAMLRQMQTTTRSGLDETRRVLSDLRATPLDEMGLVVALRILAEDFAARKRLELILETPEMIDDVPGEVEQCYYRVAQEALENVARHANAQHLTLRLERDNGCLVMMIEDDGSGFAPTAIEPGPRLGLQGMRERAELVGANLTIDSQPGQGTQIRLTYEKEKK